LRTVDNIAGTGTAGFSGDGGFVFVGILLAFAPASLRQQLDYAEIRIVLANLTPNDVISTQLSGVWHNGYVPRDAQVSITGQVVR